MSLEALPRAVIGAAGDVLGPRLRGYVAGAALAALALLAASTWAAIHFLLPLIPHLTGHFAWVNRAGSFAAGAGTIVLAIVLWPAVSMAIGSALFDAAAERVERLAFPADPPGKAPRFADSFGHALRTAPATLALNLLALPFLFAPGLNAIVFLTLNAYLCGRDYFTLAALRHRPAAQARALRKRHRLTLFLAGLSCAALLYVPLLNFFASLYGAALMVRLDKRLS